MSRKCLIYHRLAIEVRHGASPPLIVCPLLDRAVRLGMEVGAADKDNDGLLQGCNIETS
jgi:hypothetical protein